MTTSSLVSDNTTEPQLYIQGDTDNTWLLAQDWQKHFILNLHKYVQSSSVADSSSGAITSPYFTTNRKYEYMAFPISKENSLLCLDLTPVHTSMNLKQIPFYGGYGWIWGYSTTNDPYKSITPPMGVLVNLKTGVSRYYVFTTSSASEVAVNHPHTGPLRVCRKCSENYKSQKRSGVLVPDFDQ